jgi:hypothetical protein
MKSKAAAAAFFAAMITGMPARADDSDISPYILEQRPYPVSREMEANPEIWANRETFEISAYASVKTAMAEADLSHFQMNQWGGNERSPAGAAFSGAAGIRMTTPRMPDDFSTDNFWTDLFLIFCSHMRVEAEFSAYLFGNDEYAPGAKGGAATYMANLYFDLLGDFRLGPYLGFGGGYGHFDHTSLESAKGGWAAAAYAGLAFRIAAGFYADAGARFSVVAGKNAELVILGAGFGLRYAF